MSHTNVVHRRTHNLLLISKLLSQQSQASPFTLVIDTLELPAKPLLREYLRRAKLSKGTITVFLAFETVAKLKGVDYFVPCQDTVEGVGWQRIVKDATEVISRASGKKFLIMIDSLMTLASLSQETTSNMNFTAFFSSLLQPPPGSDQGQQPQISVVAVYHIDSPLPSLTLPPISSARHSNAYAPPPLTLLSYLATSIITVHSLSILLSEKAAQARSLATPSFGLSGQIEGVMVGLKPKAFTDLKPDERGIVLELEHRRKSGSGVREWFFLPSHATSVGMTAKQSFRETVTLLDDHPLFCKPNNEPAGEQEISGMTFELGLTERQKLEREGVVLPYFDAQKTGGGGEGGRILYDMGVEDDFDEEEDEI